MASARPFIFNAGETTITSTGEHLEEDNEGFRDTQRPENHQRDGKPELILPNENRLPMARGSKGNGIQHGL